MASQLPVLFNRQYFGSVRRISLDSLNPSQRQAAAHVEGPLLVLAGPGSGKTRVVTHRVANLIQEGVPAHQIVALTFTNKAADEMRRRVTDLVGPQPVEMGTFHRFAARLLRSQARLVGLTSDYSILDPDDSHSVLKRAAKRLGLSLTHTPIGRIAGTISRAKNDLVTPETFEPRWGRPADEVVGKVWPLYQEMLLEANSVDFDDLLVHIARLLLDNPDLRRQLDARYRWMLVDEYQDTNAVQYCILRGLSLDHQNLAVTGDPDQAIYGWRGASIRNILEFERDYPAATVVTLEQNYRSTSNILGTADRVIAHNSRRKPKRLVTNAEPGPQVRIVLDSSSHDEADRIADEIAAAVSAGSRQPRDFCILFRTNALSRSLEVALRNRQLPYQLIRGLEFFKRREVRDVVAWLRLLKNPRDDEALLRIVNVPPRGIGKQSLDRLAAWAEQQGLSRLEATRQAVAVPGLSKRAIKAYSQFGELVESLQRLQQRSNGAVAPLVEAILDQTGYRDLLAAEKEEEGDERLANVEELVTAARQVDESFTAVLPDDDPLGQFLEQTALVADTDIWDPAGNQIALMTFHACKGLEFPVVYMVALEDGILPHERSLDDDNQLEEERRLVFVGITRGQQEVHASAARIRDYRGSRRISAPSIFLTEMLGEETLLTGPEAPALGQADTSFDDADWHADPTDPFADCFESHPDAVDDLPVEQPNPAPAHRLERPDGLVLEVDGERPAADPPPAQKPPGRKRKAADLAIRLASELGAPAEPPVLQTGERVAHETYGPGTLERISGSGPRAIGVVRFDGALRTRSFVLAHGGLQRLTE
ncbi:MAG: AAA family ATPase [Planctomycetia bacterium]|nr:AAA family ATPase [Planctomycetia bacterium]